MDPRRLLLLLLVPLLVVAGSPALAAADEGAVELDLLFASVAAGGDTTATLTATRDDVGVPGLTVSFEHTGPAVDEAGSGSAVTDAEGLASYSIDVPADADGELAVTALVTDADGQVVGEAGPITVGFSFVVCRCWGPGLRMKNVGGGTDWARVGRLDQGTEVRLFRIHDNGRRTLVRRGTVGEQRQKIFLLPDPARRHVRTYQAVVRLPDGMRGVTPRVSIR